MAFQPDDPSALETAQLASYANRFTGKDTTTESFLGKLARAEAQGLWSYEKKLQRISLDTVPNAQSTYARLSDWATVLALPNGAGGTGPLVATPATGGVGTATGANGATVPNNAPIIAPDGSTVGVIVNGPYSVGAGLTVSVDFNFTTPGSAGNLSLPAVVTFISPPSGLQATIAVNQAPAGGTDQESATALLARIWSRLQDPPKGGTQHDWDTWSGDPVTAVNRVYGYARRSGTGTIDEVVTYAPNALGTGPSRRVTSTDLSTIGAFLDTVRPVAVEGRNILTPYMPTANALTIRTRIVAYPAGAFDWSSNALGLTVSAYSTGTGTGGGDQVTLSQDAGADLQAAIAAYVAGNAPAPRIQLVSSAANAPIVPLQVRAILYTQVAGPLAKLDLLAADVAQPGYVAPNTGDAVYAGGAAPTIIASAQLAYVNALGPSRISGFADPNDAWNDSVETEQLSRIALDAVDGSGNPLAKNTVKVAGVPQVLIAVGSNAATTNDYQTLDDGNNPPECANAVHVVVTD